MARSRNKADSLERDLADLRDLAAAGPTPELEVALRQALDRGSSFMAGAAAKHVKTHRLAALEADLIAAFDRFMEDPGKTDKGCLAKLPIVEALLALNYVGAEVYLTGVRHRQLEPSWGPPVDTAANLRATCAMALVRIAWPDVRLELVRLLADPEPQPRASAVAELASLGSDSDLLLLQLLLQIGGSEDDDLELRGDCMGALLQQPERYMPLVAGYLQHPDDRLQQLAALAIGESRAPDAYAILYAAWDARLQTAHRRNLVLPMALTRDPAAFDLLMPRLDPGTDVLAPDILSALWLCYPTPEHRNRLQAAVLASPNDRLILAYRDLKSQEV